MKKKLLAVAAFLLSLNAHAAEDAAWMRYCAISPDGYVVLEEAISTEQYAVGFLKGNTALRDAVNAELKKMAEDGTMLKIAENYVDDGLVIESLCMLAD